MWIPPTRFQPHLILILLLPTLHFALVGCSILPAGTGADNELAILIDEELREKVQHALLQTFCPIIDTPQPERRFIPIFGGLNEIEKLQTQQFLLLVGTLDGAGEISKLIAKMLSPEVAQGVSDGQYYLFEKKNEWARDQHMVILITSDAPSLVSRLTTESSSLFKTFNDLREQKIHQKLFNRYERKDLAADIRERFGLDLRIPHDYVIVREEPESGWLRLKRAAPDRWITLWKSQVYEENPLDSAFVIDKWSELAAQFADPIRMNPDYLKYKRNPSGYFGFELRGLWETVGPQGGGPFFCRMFYNTVDNRVYMFEGEVYNPGDVKEPYLKQLEVILATFEVREAKSKY